MSDVPHASNVRLNDIESEILPEEGTSQVTDLHTANGAQHQAADKEEYRESELRHTFASKEIPVIPDTKATDGTVSAGLSDTTSDRPDNGIENRSASEDYIPFDVDRDITDLL